MKQIVNCRNHIEKHLHDFTQMAGINRELQDHTNRQCMWNGEHLQEQNYGHWQWQRSLHEQSTAQRD